MRSYVSLLLGRRRRRHALALTITNAAHGAASDREKGKSREQKILGPNAVHTRMQTLDCARAHSDAAAGGRHLCIEWGRSGSADENECENGQQLIDVRALCVLALGEIVSVP